MKECGKTSMAQTKSQKQWTPTQRLGRALNRGIYIGAQLGMAAGIGFMLFTGAPIPFFDGGFSGLLGFSTSALTIPAVAIAETVSGIIAGAAFGGVASTTLHAVVQTVPGLAYALGDAPPRFKDREVGMKPSRGQARSRSKSRAVFDETDDRNYGFRRMIEEQRIQEEQRDMGR